MSEQKPPNPRRRKFFENFFVNLGREAGKAYAELRKAREELSNLEHELTISFEDPAPALDDSPTVMARLDEIDAELIQVKAQAEALIDRTESLQMLAEADRELLRQLLERLPERKEELAEPPADSPEPEEVAQRRRDLARRLNEVIRLLLVWLAARSPDVLAETIFSNEIWPWAKTQWQTLFAEAEASGLIETSPLPTSITAPPPQPVEPPTPVETPRPPRREQGRSRTSFPELVPVPAGWFWMGSDKRQDKNAYDDKLPQHRLHLPAYRIGRTPVTVTQFEAFVKATGYQTTAEKEGSAWVWTGGSQWETIQGANWRHPRGPDSDVSGKEQHPVTCISWYDARAYCDWLSRELGQAMRLPTEAEWEKAARGTDGRLYPWRNEAPDESRCNFNMNVKDTTPVGKYPRGASPYGCLDMAGNVLEWTQSLWGKDVQKPDFGYPYNPNDGREDIDAPDSVRRVLRGGSFRSDRLVVRCACRIRGLPGIRFNLYGFRVVSPGL
ncbi:MAG: formylglycine-generating enzyme family protein [Caldilineaceae bacterium]|nr:formylglycine-generating enzyme family protein [Caldilineaceae bacterium]